MLAWKILPFGESNDIKTGFSDLPKLCSEESRASIIQDIVSKDVTARIVGYFQDLRFCEFAKDVAPYLTLSWAWMIKIKLFTSPHGELRLHIFPTMWLGEAAEKIWGNCHVHDFQSFSRVLLGKVVEEQYTICPSDNETNTLFDKMLWLIWNIDLPKVKELSDTLDRILVWSSSDSDIELISSIFAHPNPLQLARIFKVYDGKKRQLQDWKIVEEFNEIGRYIFDYKGVRNINAWDS